MKVLVFNPDLCTGCRICEETCSKTWFKEANAAKSAIRITEGGDAPGRFVATFCDQCGECIDVCPTMALRRDKRGVLRIDKELCVGCMSCVGFCPILAMYVHPDHILPFKCNASGRCVKDCPEGALSIEDLADAPLTHTEKRMKVVA